MLVGNGLRQTVSDAADFVDVDALDAIEDAFGSVDGVESVDVDEVGRI